MRVILKHRQAGGAVIHSGSECIQFNLGANASETLTRIITKASVGNFSCMGGFIYGDGTKGIFLGSTVSANAELQKGSGATILKELAKWNHVSMVLRFDANASLGLRPDSSAVGNRYADDVYSISLDDIILTVTPASEANSTEQSGLRVDGLDRLDQPIAANTNVAGSYNARYISRHAIGDVGDFGNTNEYLYEHYEDANNYIFARRENNLIRLGYNANGGGYTNATYNATGTWNANVEKLIRVEYSSSGAVLYIDGVAQITIPGAVAFAANWTQPVDWGTSNAGTEQFDGIVKAP